MSKKEKFDKSEYQTEARAKLTRKAVVWEVIGEVLNQRKVKRR